MRRFLRAGLLTLPFLFASFAFGQITGGIAGRVTDEQGGALPGVTVEARSPALQGSRIATTDGTGAYHLNLLAPGDYTVTFTLEGFAAETRKLVKVGLDQDVSLSAALHAAVKEEI